MESIYSLKGRLSEENTLIVQNERGFIMETEFEWNQPASELDIMLYEKNSGIILPQSYKKFLKLSNGAILFKDKKYGQWGCSIYFASPLTIFLLFKDKKYGQWGCKVYGASELTAINEQIRTWRQIPDSWLVFATWIGDGDMLMFDINKYKAGEKDYIIDGDECDSENDFCYIKGDFEKWIDRLIVSQGSKYWRW